MSDKSGAARKRWYEDACGAAFALDLIGERWSILILRELMLGPRRFSDLKSSLHGISANVLTQRLEGLEASRILRKRRLPPPASAQVYELTDWGYEAEPIVQMLGRWATRHPDHDPRLPLSAVSLMLSFRTMFDPERAAGLTARIGFAIGEEGFVASVDNGRFDVQRQEPRRVDLLWRGSAEAIAAAVYGGEPIERLQAGGVLEVIGEPELAIRFVSLFPLPPKLPDDD